jgi:hypothetical protein
MEEAGMCGQKATVALAVITALGILGTAALASKDDIDTRGDRGGSVRPCSLDGVNPARHPEVFGDAATARSFGFVRSRDGTWHVDPNCHR